MNSKVTGKFISSPEQEDGRSQQESSDGKTRRKFGPARPRANRSVVQEGKKVRTTRGIYGPTFINSPTPAGPLSLLESRLRERLAAIGSTKLPLIWKELVTPAGRSISRLAPSTPRTSDSDSTGSQPQMAYWRTPLVHHDSRRPKGTDLKGNWIKDDQTRIKIVIDLPYQVRHHGTAPNGDPERMETSGVLNPTFASWLMGFPDAWTQTVLSATASYRSSRRKS